MERSLSKLTLNKAKSQISFTIDHLVISKVVGKFNTFGGYIETCGDLCVDYAELDIDSESLETGNSVRDRNLRGKNYFNCKKYPEILCTVRNVKLKNYFTNTVEVNVKIKDIEKTLKFDLFLLSYSLKNISVRVIGKINTGDFNLKWQSPFIPSAVIGSEARVEAYLTFEKTS
ncbi:hypothetical protein [Thermoplasma volcanium GSS1]|uniref:Lipid/polyisoprenoid-binding YceI-like domain-containing protein n=1 Tax=Thermoplasma volcanium (strain ATCC 51530 / DSM 4299 / JCM 9571 / NBRC 15438 / GSS1) TaxID=273116 RepID=Q97BT6_THEVO|nr:YceI family protein [Thermoplasma volcanium]BAB59511.1 hypothetical protein [Thermoplasma volcanium GSS1]